MTTKNITYIKENKKFRFFPFGSFYTSGVYLVLILVFFLPLIHFIGNIIRKDINPNKIETSYYIYIIIFTLICLIISILGIWSLYNGQKFHPLNLYPNKTINQIKNTITVLGWDFHEIYENFLVIRTKNTFTSFGESIIIFIDDTGEIYFNSRPNRGEFTFIKDKNNFKSFKKALAELGN